mmetsp:Transcript_19939/g.50283  ORF Transcript_19939/g.50283 Transcript_19939/m.50283 type:complete len:287 (-) Transcript_19939:108-968(-)
MLSSWKAGILCTARFCTTMLTPCEKPGAPSVVGSALPMGPPITSKACRVSWPTSNSGSSSRCRPPAADDAALPPSRSCSNCLDPRTVGSLLSASVGSAISSAISFSSMDFRPSSVAAFSIRSRMRPAESSVPSTRRSGGGGSASGTVAAAKRKKPVALRGDCDGSWPAWAVRHLSWSLRRAVVRPRARQFLASFLSSPGKDGDNVDGHADHRATSTATALATRRRRNALLTPGVAGSPQPLEMHAFLMAGSEPSMGRQSRSRSGRTHSFFDIFYLAWRGCSEQEWH